LNPAGNEKTQPSIEAPSCRDYKTLVGVFKALSDASRQKMLLLLEESGEMRVSDLVDRLGISQPTMSHHLGVLKHAGLVNNRRAGQSIFYSVNRGWLNECCSGFMSQFEDDD
jgi:ArsR family transcriptional regulator